MDHIILETNYTPPFGNKSENYKFRFLPPNSKFQILVNDKPAKEEDYNDILCRVFSMAVDMDKWQHSWHIKISDFIYAETKNKIIKIIHEKIIQREQELDFLKGVECIIQCQLSDLPIIEDEGKMITPCNDEEDYLPF